MTDSAVYLTLVYLSSSSVDTEYYYYYKVLSNISITNAYY
jgi:hypothetical protein